MKISCDRARRRAGRGFSLIELLVAISVLLLLVAMLLPSLHTAVRTSAPLLKCSNNLNQIHQALTMYMADSDGYLPIAGYEPLRESETPVLNQTLRRYGVESIEFWICPGDERPTIVQQTWGSFVYPVARLLRSNRVRLKMSDLGPTYPLIADRGPFHMSRPRERTIDIANEPHQKPMVRYAGTIFQDGFREGHNALLAQGQITHHALGGVEEDSPPQRSWWRRLLPSF